LNLLYFCLHVRARSTRWVAMGPIRALILCCAIAGARGVISSCALPGTCEDVSSEAVASNSMLQVVKKSTQIQLEAPNCKLYLGLNLPQPGDPVKCHAAGTFMSDLGEQCMKQKAADGTISQRCDGAPGHSGTFVFLCSKFAAVPNKCCTAGGVQYICAGDDGFLSGPEATDFDECSQTCPGYVETTTTEAKATEKTTTEAEATTTTMTTKFTYADQYCQYHVFNPTYNIDVRGKLYKCTPEGKPGQPPGYRCVKVKTSNAMVQMCDGALKGGEMTSMCESLEALHPGSGPGQCFEQDGWNAAKTICSGDGGFPDFLQSSDWDHCGVTTTTATTTTFPKGCEPWCREPPKPGKPETTWAQKCGWDEEQQIVVPSTGWKSCKNCWECDNVGQEFSDKCADWCAEKPEPWETKCEWKFCKKCNKCNTMAASSCPQWCGQASLDSCKWAPCKPCKTQESSPCMKPPPCDAYCGQEDVGGWKNTCKWKGCKGCEECQKNRMLMAHTTLTVPAKAGDVVIQTDDSMGFAVGDKGFLEKSTANEEAFVVSGFGSLVFEEPLQKSHPPNATIDIDESQTTGSTAALNQDGYAAVAALRCARQMMDFVMRVAVNEGFDICDMGGVAGFAIWFDTPEEGKTYDALVSEIKVGAAGDCPFLVASGGACKPLASTCPSFPGQELPECARD